MSATASTSSGTHAVQDPAPNGDSGTTIDPLQYNCGNDAPTCGQVGESNGYYNGTNVDLLYSENYYCDPSVPSNDPATGCEAGAPASANPTGMSADGTMLGNTKHSDTLYIPVPVGFTPPPTQCVGSATCIDHPPTIDLSALAGSLGAPASSLDAVPIPAHDHVVATRNGGLPEWWNVQVVATKSLATFNTLTSLANIQTAEANGNPALAATAVPTNAFLFFQVLPGTLSASMAADLTATAPPGAPVPMAPNAPPASQVESGTTFNNLMNDCGATAPNCQNIGISRDWIEGQDVEALYTEQYFCASTSVTVHSSSGCEAGADPTSVPPDVGDTTDIPTPANSYPVPANDTIDPLYIPVPLYASPPVAYNQCASAITCIDHPATIDLSLLASTLGMPAASLDNVPLPGHDHLLTTRNGDQPEWWNVIVIPVTSAAGLATVETSKDYASVRALEGRPGSGIGIPASGSTPAVKEVPTNAYLWFQTLPGASAPTPGPTQSSCVTHMSPGAVVGAAALDDGTATTRRTPLVMWKRSAPPPVTAP